MVPIYGKYILILLSLVGTGFFLKQIYEGGGALQDEAGGHGAEDSAWSNDPLVNGMLTWLHENGALHVQPPTSSLQIIPWTSPLEVDSSKKAGEDEEATGRLKEYGVITPHGYEKGEVLISLPPALWVVGENITEGRTWKGRGPAIAPQVKPEGSSWDTGLALWLLQERAKGQDSFFAPYINFLPKQVPSLLTFSAEELKEIHYEPLFKHATYYVDEYIAKMHAHMASEGLLPPEFSTVEDYRWAASVVWSRAFTVNYNSSSIAAELETADPNLAKETLTASMLLPFFDMLNHNAPPDTHWNMEDGHIQLVANVAGVPGSVVHDSYGERPNDDFALGYGFIIENNPNDRAVLFGNLEELLYWYKSIYRRHTDLEDSPEAIAEHNFFEFGAPKAAGIALTAVKTELETISTLETAVQTELLSSQDSLSIWPEGRLEPRLLAILGAVGRAHTEVLSALSPPPLFEESGAPLPYYQKIASASIMIAQDLQSRCDLIDPEVATFVVFAAHALRWKVEDVVAGYPTTADEDRYLLEASGSCASPAEGANHESPEGTCDWKELSANVKLAVKLRLEKKKILLGMVERMDRVCADSEGPEVRYEDLPESMYAPPEEIPENLEADEWTSPEKIIVADDEPLS